MAMRRVVVASLFLASVGGARAPAADDAPPPAALRPSPDRGGPVIGRLANGARYAVLRRRSTEPGVAVLMRNEGGFIAERRPGERGLAHLIEHIAFHSPVVAAPDEGDRLPRIGLPLTLPAPDAGSTSWRETNYYLSTRTKAVRDLDVILGLFREVATDMTLRADAVELSRGEVVREMAGKAAGNATYAAFVAAVAPGSPNDVIAAQNSDDVPTATIATIRAIYRRLYRPERMTIVVVGDIAPDEAVASIARRFGRWHAATPAPRRVPFPQVRRDRIRPASFASAPDGRRAALIAMVSKTPPQPSSRDRQAAAAAMDLMVTQAVNARLRALQPGSPAGKTGMVIDNGEQGYRQILLWDHVEGDGWPAAIAGLRRVTCALATSGFTAAEWATAQRTLIADLERRAAAMADVANVEVAKDLSHALADDRHPILPDAMLQHARLLAARTDARGASAWWRRQWRAGTEHVRVEAPELATVAEPLAAIRRAAAGEGRGAACGSR